MSTTLHRPALNVPLLALWAASLGVAAVGYLLLQGGNAALAEFYTTGGEDYNEFLGLQSQGTVGGLLLAAGVVGVFLALATHARNRAATVVAARPITAPHHAEPDVDDVDPDEIDDLHEQAPDAAADAVSEEPAAVPARA